jgi:isopenicillin-N N-acyltransferase-like protein
VRRFSFEGTPKAIGESYGEALRAEIGELYRLRVKNALSQAKDLGGRDVDEGALLRLARRCLPASEAYDRDGYAEVAGIARGSGLTIEQVFALNGLTDLRDVLAFGDMALWREEGCSSFVVQGDLADGGHVLLGQTWDLATDNMPFVVFIERRPDDRPRTWSMTTAGCLSLIGMNEIGIAIGTTNIRTTDSRVGVTYLQIIHRALRAEALESVERAIVEAPRAGAHYYYAADAHDRAIAVECTATRAEVARIERAFHVHCNHVLDEANKTLEAQTPMKSSVCRQSRMGQLIAGAQKPIGVDALERFLADHEGGADAICRHDYAGISSNGSVIMRPATREMWMVHGQACKGTWEVR